jgi:hypothetical protein
MYGVIDVPKAVPIHLHTRCQSTCPSCVVADNLLFLLVSMSGCNPSLPIFNWSLVFMLHEYLVAGCVIGSL